MLDLTPNQNKGSNEEHLLKNLTNNAVRKEWHNNNSTLEQRAYIIDLKDIDKAPAKIINQLYQHNRQNGNQPLVAVPVAGWDVPPVSFSLFTCFSQKQMEQRLIEEYAQSFSLSPFTTAKNADLILRIAASAQKMVLKGNQLTVTPGVRITDADAFLAKKGFALPFNMPTLHVASLVGAAANGCYGPGRDFGPMTSNIVKMKIINALGEKMTLSAKENPDLFGILRDCHMGVCFVRKITFGNIQPQTLLKRRNVLFQDVQAFSKKAQEKNPLSDEHFILMYIPVDIDKTENHTPRIRVTTFKKADPSEKRDGGCCDNNDLCTYLNLMETEAGEPLIELIASSENLQKYFPIVLKAAALKTYGLHADVTEIDWSPAIAHVFSTYTDLPIDDYNWLIQVNSADEARDLLTALLQLTETHLKEFAKTEHYPLFNAFARYLKGIHYPNGEGGVAATAIDQPHRSILSFELLSYSPLANTPAFKQLVDEVVKYLNLKGYKFKYHPGKTMPENIKSLTQTFVDAIDVRKLNNYQDAVFKLHGGKQNIPFSPFLTPQKRKFIGLNVEGENTQENHVVSRVSPGKCTKTQEQAALRKIIQLAEEHHDDKVAAHAKNSLSN